MTIQQCKSRITSRDLETKSVWVQTTLSPNPFRVVGVGRTYLTVLTRDGVRRIDPIIVTEIRM